MSSLTPPSRTPERRDAALGDVAVLVALALVAVACLSFRYLPMVDLPQHYGMVSILRHHADPAWDFSKRYTFDFLGRPYATVYLLAAALSWVMPLGAAMRITVAICTVAPFAGMWSLLVALNRPRAPLLVAIPFAFGSIWHWGFLNFLLGTGLFIAGLALVSVATRSDKRLSVVALLALGPLLLATHFHGLVMLLSLAPVFAFATRGERGVARAMRRGVAPLVPGGLLAAAFVLMTWRQATGSWARMNPDLSERLSRFPEFLAGGLVDPFPVAFCAALGLVSVGAFFARAREGQTPERAVSIALAAALGLQVICYLALPLNTNTATYVSARHGLLIALFVIPLVPAAAARFRTGALVVSGAVAAAGLVVAFRELACFDREAREIDPVIAQMAPNRRVLPLIFARGSQCTGPTTVPYLHFAGYYQAARGGELARTFADVWNVPIRYRPDYKRYPIREELEWRPFRVTAEDIAHFDYVLVRGQPIGKPPAALRKTAQSGGWILFENPTPLPLELPQ